MAIKSIANYLEDLVKQRNTLADNLNTMGVSAEQTELLNTLVPKVLRIGGSVNKGAIIGEVIVMHEGIVDEGIIGEASSIVYPEKKGE